MHRNRPDGVTLMLVRHGRCVDGAAGLIARPSSALCDEGREQVQGLAHSWLGTPPHRLFASDMARARESADVLTREWQMSIELDSRLAEASFGAWEGESWDRVARSDRHEFRQWASQWTTAAPPGGESLPELCRRVGAWTDNLLDRADGGSTVVAVTHAGVVRAMLITLMDIAPAIAFRFAVAPASVTAFLIGRSTEDRWCEVACVNAGSFRC